MASLNCRMCCACCAVQSADAELVEEEGPRRKWRLDYKATWSFWKVSGVCENR
jgi:hypothetical protein